MWSVRNRHITFKHFCDFAKIRLHWAKDCYHLSYGMVNLPDGKMKSREGKVVDADNLMDLLYELSLEQVQEKHEDWPEDEQKVTANKISLAALKYYLLNFSTTKDVSFSPEKSISFDGNTGPYLQYVTARINSLLTKAGGVDKVDFLNYKFEAVEWHIISKLADFGVTILRAAQDYSPLEITNYLYELAKLYNKLYHDLPVLNAETEQEKNMRLAIAESVRIVLVNGLDLLGIDALEKM